MDENQVTKQSLTENETNVVSLLLALFLPPVGVLLKTGVSGHFLLNIVLTLFGFFPGILHALWVILCR